MKKTIKTGLMIALFAVCLFLLLPFVVSERRSEENNDPQMYTQQPQVYSSNPLTALMQRAKDLFSANHGPNTVAQANALKNKRNKNKALASKKRTKNDKAGQTGENAVASARQDQSDLSGNYPYPPTPRDYEFSRYQSVAQSAGEKPTFSQSDPLFLAALSPQEEPARALARERGNYTPTKRSAPQKIMASNIAGPAASSASPNARIAAALAARPAVYGSTAAETEHSLRDIATLRANAQYPNPQTRAEQLAREEMIKKEMDKYQRTLDKLYWNSVLRPQHKNDQPDIEEFEKDVLGQIIVDRTGSNTIKSLNFVSDSAGEQEQGAPQQEQDPQEVAQIKQQLLQQQLAKNGLSLEQLSKEEQDFLQQDTPVIVTLGTTTEKTWEDVTREIARLEHEQKQQQAAQQPDEEADEEEGEEQDENTDETAPEEQGSMPYKDFLEQFLDLYEQAGCADVKCTWYAATPPDVDTLKDTEKSASYGGVTLKTDPLNLYQKFFTQTVEDAMTSKPVQPAAQGLKGMMQGMIQQATAVGQATAKFVKYANAIPYTEEQNRQVSKEILAQNKKEQNPQENADTAPTGPAPKIFAPNAFHAKKLTEDGISYEDMLTPTKSLEMLLSPEQVAAEGFVQSKINHILFTNRENNFISDEYKQSFGAATQQGYKNNPTPNAEKFNLW